MRYLIGDFSQLGDDIPIDEPKFTDHISKDELIKAKSYPEIKIINLHTMQYFNPKKNCWIDMKKGE